MDRDTWKVCLTTVLGSGLGALLALEFTPMLWWLGVLIGGMVSYITYDIRQLIRSFKEVSKMIVFKRTRLLFTLWILAFVIVFFCLLDVVIYAFVLAYSLSQQDSSSARGWAFVGIWVGVLSITIPTMYLSVMRFDTETQLGESIAKLARWSLFVFPVVFFAYFLPKWILIGVVKAIPYLKRFGYELFIRIHSERRLLCGTTALLGGSIGYFSGSVLIGMCVGGVIGVISYEVISKRLLKHSSR